MRIPSPIAILICLLVIAATWFLGTRDIDFHKLPTSEQLADLGEEWQKTKERPGTSERQPFSLEQAAIEKLPMGNLLEDAKLSEYHNLGHTGSQTLVKLASHLESIGELRRSLLAWERVLDSSVPTEAERKLVIVSIKRLRVELPVWRTDPKQQVTISLNAGASTVNEQLLESAQKDVAALINEASGNTVLVDTQSIIGKNSQSSENSRLPIAIWFSRKGENPVETNPTSIPAEYDDEALLASQIKEGIYRMMRSHFKRNTSFSPLPELTVGVDPDEMLRYHITRLMWREYAKGMKE